MQKTIYTGGNILTMDPRAKGSNCPEAVLVQDGRIAGLGRLFDLREVAPDARVRDLGGHTLMPGFIDPHSHITSFASTLGLVPLSGAKSFDDIAEKITAFMNANAPAPDAFLSGFGYDNNFLAEKAHPTKELLDGICPDRPLLIAHASGHMGVANSKALQMLGISADTPDPEGGRIGRMTGSREPSGYLEETAFTQNSSKIPLPSIDQRLAELDRAQDIYLAHGITTAQDGLTRTAEWQLLSQAAEADRLKIDVVSYLDLNLNPELRENSRYWQRYYNRLKLGGYKIFLDGSPQGRTAWMTKPYLGEDPTYCGYPIYSDEKVKSFMMQALNDNAQILCHCNGDAAAQQMIDAYEAAAKETDKSGIRPVMIHAQMLRKDQLPMLAKLGIIASFFVAHTYYWGDIHLQNFGKERADYISPAHSALENGVLYTFHQDTPVLLPDMLDTVQRAVERRTKNGVQLAQSECVSVYDALKAVTINAAEQYFEESQKGSIAVGKLADFVILEEDPLTVAKDHIKDIKILETIKQGKTLYTHSKS